LLKSWPVDAANGTMAKRVGTEIKLKRMKNILIVACIITCTLGFVNNAYTQAPGNLDLTFANAGELADSNLIFPFKYSSIALSQGNELVISSATGDTIQSIRYTTDGVRDSSFGLSAAGYVQVVTPGFSGTVTTSLVQPDQKILIAGQYAQTGVNKKAYLLRLNANGTIDNTFGTNGWFFFNFFPAYGEFIRQIALQSNGNIVALDIESYTGVTDTFMVVRLKANGTYDNTFAGNGKYQVPFYNFLNTSPSAFMLDTNNNFICAAYSNYNQGDYFYLFRLTPNGAADVTYGSNGSILIDSTNIINGGADLGLNFQSDGKLITVQTKQTGSLLWAVCRYNTDGSTDQGFGINGMVNVMANLDPVPYSVQNIAVTATGQIITAGVVNIAGANRVIVNSFNKDGSVDAAFGNNSGSELLNGFQWDDIVYNLLIQPDNKIVINGLINEADYRQFEVARLMGTTGSTGVQDMNGNPGFKVYPNPANTRINFELTRSGEGTVSLKDVTGKVIVSSVLNGATLNALDIGNLASGVYIITWLSKEGSTSKMIVKQ